MRGRPSAFSAADVLRGAGPRSRAADVPPTALSCDGKVNVKGPSVDDDETRSQADCTNLPSTEMCDPSRALRVSR
jgi:hypothetical protein